MPETIGPTDLSAERIGKSSWNLRFNGRAHTVELRHSKWGMATSVMLDGELVFKSGDLFKITYSADIPLTVNERNVVLSIRNTTFGSNYSISVDGELLDGPDPTLVSVDDDRNRWNFQAALFTFFVGAPALYFLGGPNWFVGPTRADYFAIALFSLSGLTLAKQVPKAMRNLTLVLVLMTLAITGCSDPARPHLEELVGRWGQVVGKQFPELKDRTGDERKIRYLYLTSEATSNMLTDYLEVSRPISPDLKQLLTDWRVVTLKSMEIHKRMIDENRFTYTEDEKATAERLVRADAEVVIELMDRLKGY